MHVVVNQITLQESTDWADLATKVDQFQTKLAKEHAEFHGISLVRVSDSKAIFLVFFDNRDALDEISKNIAAPWFAEHVRPHLAGPVDRSTGEIVAGSMK